MTYEAGCCVSLGAGGKYERTVAPHSPLWYLQNILLETSRSKSPISRSPASCLTDLSLGHRAQGRAGPDEQGKEQSHTRTTSIAIARLVNMSQGDDY